MGGRVSLGRLFGIPIGFDLSWLLIVALVTWSLASGFFPTVVPGLGRGAYWVLGLVAALLLFAAVVAHELAHALVARARGVRVRDITLFVFGGVASLAGEARKPLDDIVIAIAGPATSLLVALLCLVSLRTLDEAAMVSPGKLGGTEPVVMASPVAAMLTYLGTINVLLALFNLIPAFPLDGGRVLRGIIWAATRDLRTATRASALVGQIFGLAFMAAGVYLVLGGELPIAQGLLSGLWLIFIGWFLSSAAAASAQQQELTRMLGGVRVGRVMRPVPPSVPPGVSLRGFIDEFVLRYGSPAFPVAEDGRLLGIISLEQVKDRPREQWEVTSVQAVMQRAADLPVVSPRQDVASALEWLSEHESGELPVVEGGQLVGLVSRAGVLRYLRLHPELGVDTTRRAA